MPKTDLGYVKTVPTRDAYTYIPIYTAGFWFDTKPAYLVT